MRHFYTVKYFDDATHSWVCEDNSSLEEVKLIFTGFTEPCPGDQISVSYTNPVILEGVGLQIEPKEY